MKKINEGSYGCIYYPAVTCNLTIKKNKKYISKIVVNDEISKNEIEIGKLIEKKKIKGLRGIKSSCVIKKGLSLKNILKKNTCSIIKNNEDSSLVKMDFEYLDGCILNNYINKINLIDSYKECINHLKNLNNLNICHFDIKENNIFYNRKDKNLYIIDFGISINIEKLKKNNNYDDYFSNFYSTEHTEESYEPWCIDIVFLNDVINKKKIIRNEKEVREIVNTFINNSFFNKKKKKFKKIYYNECIKYLNSFINKSIPFIKRNIIKNWKTWDIYSLSIIFIKFIKLYNLNNKKLLEMLFLTLHPNPKKRLNYENITKILKTI